MKDSIFVSITRILPPVILAAGLASSAPNLKAEIVKLMDCRKVIATQQAVLEIARTLQLDASVGTRFKQEAFVTYLQRSRSAKDSWGQTYRLAYGKSRRELVVSSAGPDAQFDTADDVRALSDY